ncbi:hypothetical protein AeNC1_011112 [Aphanomyces euteiches]|nr:hypothetical protein AeNC1_011112 [Aphanomyces euteiches]
MASSSLAVLTSLDLVRQICHFQRGVLQDMVPFLPFGWLDDWYFALSTTRLASIQAVFHPWYNRFGLARLPRLMEVLPFADMVALIYGAYNGDASIFKALSASSAFTSPRFRIYILLDVAITSENPRGALECLAYLALSVDVLFAAMGNAVSHGNLVIAQALARRLEAQDEAQRQRWFTKVTRNRTKWNLKAAVHSNDIDSVCWLLTTLSKYAPATCPKWIARCRRDCRRWALEFEHFESLARLSNAKMDRANEHSEDLIYCIQSTLLVPATWLVLEKKVPVQRRHVLDAAKYFQPRKPKSRAVFELILSNVHDKDDRTEWITACMRQATAHGRKDIKWDQIL